LLLRPRFPSRARFVSARSCSAPMNKSRNRVERNKRDAALFAALADANQLPVAPFLAFVIKGPREMEERIAAALRLRETESFWTRSTLHRLAWRNS
jgi:hypothetical protein